MTKIRKNKALTILEFDKILDILAEFTSNDAVKEKIYNLTPSKDKDEAEALQSETTQAQTYILKYGSCPNLAVPPVINSVRRCEVGGVLSMRELLNIASVLYTARNAKKYLENAKQDESGTLFLIASSLTDVKMLEQQIKMCIISEEEVADGASGELLSIRRKMSSLKDKIKDILDSYIHSSKYIKYLQEPIVTMRSDRYVIPVKSENRNEISGVVHDTSSTGATVFIEPMSVVNANNEIRDLKGKEQAEIERILAQLSSQVSEYKSEIETNYYQLCELDFIFCKAKLSLKYNATEAKINDSGEIYLKKARHPLIDSKNVVANDIYLGGDFDTLVITGPNTGGKTVTLKTIGLFCIMAAAGLHIPALDNSKVSVFNKIWADIGDEQSIEQSLSTFSSHMKNIVNIVNHIDSKSLALFDELGAGTDPTEGAALAVSVLEYLRLYGAKCAATTHYSELKTFALTTPGVCNASCEFDIKTLNPTYKLLIGVPGKSNAFAISAKLGLNKTIIESAKSMMTKDNLRFEDLISSIEEKRRLAEKEAQTAQALRSEIAKLNEEAKNQKEKLEKSREKILDEARREAKRIVAGAKDECSKIVREANKLQKSGINAKQIEKIKSGLKKKENEIDESFSDVLRPKVQSHAPKTVKEGDSVEVLSLSQIATVLSPPDKDKNVYVQAGPLKISVKLDGLRLVTQNAPQTKKTKTDYAAMAKTYVSKKANIKSEIDLRGMTLEEALLETDQFISDAYVAGLTQISIIHGKGTGVLRAGISDMLKRHKLVKSYRLGKYGEGETGVTIAELK